METQKVEDMELIRKPKEGEYIKEKYLKCSFCSNQLVTQNSPNTKEWWCQCCQAKWKEKEI